MNIFHFIPSLHSSAGGPMRAVFDLGAKMAEAGDRVTIATTRVDLTRDSLALRPGMKIIDIGPPPLPRCTLSGRQLSEIEHLLRGTDVVHLHGVWEYGNVQIARLARRCRKPYVVSAHGMLDKWSMAQNPLRKRLYLAMVGGKFLRDAACVHLTAEKESAQAAQWAGAAPRRVVPYLLDLWEYASVAPPELAEPYYPNAARPRILFLSRLHPKKGLDLLLRTVQALRAAHTDFSLVIAGSGETAYENKLRQLIEELDLEGYVTLAGSVVGAAKIALYQSADFFVLPTQQENFGFVLFEALAAGTPVLTTFNNDLSEELSRCRAVKLCDYSEASLLLGLQTIMEAISTDREIRHTAKNWAFEMMDSSSIVASFHSLYADAIGRARDAP